MADVTLIGVVKDYPNGYRAVHGIDLAIDDGEMVVIVGPSGCGKSTLLRMVAGLERITEGEARIGGERVNEREPADRDIAMVFQNYALYPHMNVFQNMAYGLKNRGVPKAEIEERVGEAARILELPPEMLTRRPRQLSGGQRQRVAMGRAIVRKPKAFLFDEPLSNLDAKLRVQMRLEIKKLQRALATTSIYVTHDQVEAMTLADRLVVMNAGVAEQVGTPMDVYLAPATTFVAGFIGSPAMNFLAARVGEDGAEVRIEGGEVLPLGRGGFAANLSVTLGIRPEDFMQAHEEGGHGVAHLHVTVVEALGADVLVHGCFGASNQDCTVRLPGRIGVDAGDTVPLRIEPERLHLFDRESGRRIN